MTQDSTSPSPLLKLDLACGRSCQPGYEGVDIAPLPGVKHVHNLLSFPYPFADGSVSEVFSSHFVEHLPMLFWTPAKPGDDQSWTARLTPYQVDETSVELFLKFFDEIWRILAPNGKATIHCPQAQNVRAFQDPSHRRFLVPQSFLYLDREWRRANGLEHGAYGSSMDFRMSDSKVGFTASPDTQNRQRLMHPDAILAETRSYWNAVEDLQATLYKLPVQAGKAPAGAVLRPHPGAQVRDSEVVGV